MISHRADFFQRMKDREIPEDCTLRIKIEVSAKTPVPHGVESFFTYRGFIVKDANGDAPDVKTEIHNKIHDKAVNNILRDWNWHADTDGRMRVWANINTFYDSFKDKPGYIDTYVEGQYVFFTYDLRKAMGYDIA